MLELIAIIAGVVVCIMMPIELNKIRKGWVHKRFAGDRPKFLAAYRKQVRTLMWLGLFFGVAGIGLAALADRPRRSRSSSSLAPPSGSPSPASPAPRFARWSRFRTRRRSPTPALDDGREEAWIISQSWCWSFRP